MTVTLNLTNRQAELLLDQIEEQRTTTEQEVNDFLDFMLRALTTALASPTREEFTQEYARLAGVTIERLAEMGRRAEPCDCGEADCKGWRMGYVCDHPEITPSVRQVCAAPACGGRGHTQHVGECAVRLNFTNNPIKCGCRTQVAINGDALPTLDDRVARLEQLAERVDKLERLVNDLRSNDPRRLHRAQFGAVD